MDDSRAEAPREERSRLIPGLLTAIVLVSGVNVWLGFSRPEPETPDLTRPETGALYRPGDLAGPADGAVAAAVEAVPRTLTYDYRRLERSQRRATRMMTDRFAAQFRRTFERTVVGPARSRELVVDAVVRGAGVVRVDQGGREGRPARAVCLIYLDQRVLRSAERKSGRPEVIARPRVRVRMRLVDDAWLIDAIDRV